MSKMVLWAIIGVLAATSLGQGYYIYAQHHPKKPAVRDPWDERDKWISEARKNLLRQSPVPFSRFDDLFDDRFFGRGFDPFGEIERFHERMRALLGETERPLFSRSWDDWFEDRMDVTDIRPEVKTTDEEVILSLKIPGLAGESLNINVNDNRIRIAYDAKTVQDKKDDKGRSYFKSESARHFEKVMPVPNGADAKDYRMVHEGDVIKIIFKKIRGEVPKT